jgi:thymidylate synthase ThyX
MAILREPTIYVVGRQTVDAAVVDRFLSDYGTSWETDTEVGGELLSEMGGRLCYMSFGSKQGRRSNAEYIGNILEQRHGSVLEHAVWNLLLTGVSRSLTHELIRHRAGFGFCLTGDTLIYSDHFTRGKREGVKKRSLKQLFDMAQTPHGRSRIKLLRLRCLDEQTRVFTTGRVAAIAYSGRKPVFRVELEDGKQINCSRDHRFLTSDGWMPLHEVVGGLALSPGGLAAYGSLDVPIAVNGTLAYQDKEWLRQQYIGNGLEQTAIAELAGVSKHTIHAWVRRHGLQKPPGSWTIGRSPWNKGKKYHAGWKHTEEAKEQFRQQKTGVGNPQWRGGITRQAIQLRRQMVCLRPAVLLRDGFRCRLCGAPSKRLQVHHILPLWARPDLRYEMDNLAAICRPCHYHRVNGHELEVAEAFGASPTAVQAIGERRNRGGGNALTARFRRIVAVTYAGEQDTYDIELEGPHHNFVANGIVTHNSQLSQRYVDEADADFVEPDVIAEDPEFHAQWLEAIDAAQRSYVALADALTARLKTTQPDLGRTARRKAARQAARSVLPNATETKIFVTANARALRHFIELRGSEHAEPEIRKLAVAMLRLMQQEAPTIFGDFTMETLPDGSLATRTLNSKV